MQLKQAEWSHQWQIFQDEETFLLKDWIFPNTLEDFRGKEVLECGCGGGQHTGFISPYAQSVTAVDLNTAQIARERNAFHKNVTFIEDDIATMDLGKKFDIAISIGVIHHTDNPDKTFANIARHVKRNGRIIIWVYSREGNFLMERVLEPVRKYFLSKLSQESRLFLAKVMTLMLYPLVYSIYLLPIKFLPYYAYFQNFRRLSFQRNLLNVYDKINAPQVEFISRKRIEGWFTEGNFDNVQISPYRNVSWRASATLK